MINNSATQMTHFPATGDDGRARCVRLAPGIVLLLLVAWLLPATVRAEIRVTDDSGERLVLEQPARRIVSLAPYLTELLFAAGAGPYIVGVSDHSDYPPAALALSRIGAGTGLDLERIVALQPDLVVAWDSGNPAGQVGRLRDLGLRVYRSEPRRLEDIGIALERFGELAATQAEALIAADVYNRRLASLRRRNADSTPIEVFYQVWDRPLMTVSGRHIISDVMRLCGGVNVFDDLARLAPPVGIEAVLQRNPRVIIAAASADGSTGVLQHWQRWSNLEAVRENNLYTIPDDVLVRHTPRILDGAERLCRILDQVRDK